MKSTKKRKKRTALYYAVLGYLAAVCLTLGLLRTAQKTRQVLYGGKTVLASLVPPLEESTDSYTLSLGGGEWSYPMHIFYDDTSVSFIQSLPPCTAKWLVQTFLLTDAAMERVLDWVSVSAV